MNIAIKSLEQKKRKVLAIRNNLKYNLDKEEFAFETKFDRVDKVLIEIDKRLKKEYNNLYVKKDRDVQIKAAV